MESNFDMFNHIWEFVQKKEQKMIFYKPSQSLIKSSFETRSREPTQCVTEPRDFNSFNFLSVQLTKYYGKIPKLIEEINNFDINSV